MARKRKPQDAAKAADGRDAGSASARAIALADAISRFRIEDEDLSPLIEAAAFASGG